MSRPTKPARLWQRSTGEWLILDQGKQIRTGCRDAGGKQAAEEALAEYLSTRALEHVGPSHPQEVLVGDVLALYARDHQTVANPATLGYCIKALSDYWGDLPVSAIRGATCRSYAGHRRAPKQGVDGRERTAGNSTVRRELGVLQAACNYAHAEGKLLFAPKVTLTPSGPPKDRWLTRDEAAALLRASSPHMRRFILVSLYTGTRSAAVLGLRWGPSVASGWIDLEGGTLHRMGLKERATKKRRGSVKLPRQLQAHCTRWVKDGKPNVVHWHGRPVYSIKTGFEAACKRAGLTGVSPHTLKHTAVTWFFQKGGSMEDAVEWFDTSATTLAKYYRAHSPDFQDRARSIVERRA